MTALNVMFIAGSFFPAISLLTGAASLLDRWRHDKYSSPIFVPIIGPALLSTWVILADKPLWLIALAWTADIGTLAFVVTSPRLITDWWRTSSFTRILALDGVQGNQRAVISLHSTGHYFIKKSWSKPPGQEGIDSLSEIGNFTQTEDGFQLTSHVGVHRVLRKAEGNRYLVEEDELNNEDIHRYSLNQWVVTPT